MAFGRLERRDNAAPMSDINMTPLIDVMLVLLVIFMVAAPLMTAALHLDLPPAQSAEPGQSGTEPLHIALDAQGRLYWNEQPIESAALKARLIELGRNQPEAELQLSIDQAVPYGRVAELLDHLQGAKLSRLAFVTAAPASAAQ